MIAKGWIWWIFESSISTTRWWCTPDGACAQCCLFHDLLVGGMENISSVLLYSNLEPWCCVQRQMPCGNSVYHPLFGRKIWHKSYAGVMIRWHNQRQTAGTFFSPLSKSFLRTLINKDKNQIGVNALPHFMTFPSAFREGPARFSSVGWSDRTGWDEHLPVRQSSNRKSEGSKWTPDWCVKTRWVWQTTQCICLHKLSFNCWVTCILFEFQFILLNDLDSRPLFLRKECY